jgi:hypothetical protein
MDLWSLLAVFGLGSFELWVAVPAGLALQLHPVTISTTAALGAIMGIVVVIVTGDGLRTWLLRRFRGGSEDRPQGQIARLWTRYGVVGLGLLAPLLVGAPLGTALGMTFGAPTGRLLFWMSLGVVLCSVSLTLAGTLGLLGLAALGR